MSRYSLNFKYQAVMQYYAVNSQQRVADALHISRRLLRFWIAAYQKGGLEALEQPQAKTMNRKKRPNPFLVDKPDHQKTQAELIEELRYMRAEVDYLKELKSLSEPTTAPKRKVFKS